MEQKKTKVNKSFEDWGEAARVAFSFSVTVLFYRAQIARLSKKASADEIGAALEKLRVAEQDFARANAIEREAYHAYMREVEKAG